MEAKEDSSGLTLGQYLEQGRQDAGLSLRQLAAATSIPTTTVNRLLKDEVENPSAEHLQQLAKVLELDAADVFAFIGVTPPQGLPSVAPYLRAKYNLKGEALSEAEQQIKRIIEKYDN
ncbi:helix-turn-helix transcriptional regulator [Thermopolyspora sp. NPDC052614]|uniref:helix-turn-helix domain-containing protein n=1 Tax=Thermopolyspora sp. NPDC052614 TaxID=3155682 RepID=UPI00342DB297